MSTVAHIKRNSREVAVGNTPLGGDHPIRIQSMTKTDTRHVPATFEQCINAFDAGADYMRISVPDYSSLKAFEQIKTRLINAGYTHPLVADIHYRQNLAIEAAAIADKLRINPGNFAIHFRAKDATRVKKAAKGRAKASTTNTGTGARHELTAQLEPVVAACHKHRTAIRLGGNAGSLTGEVHSKDPLHTLINESLDYLHILESLGFFQHIISVKTSKPAETVLACQMMHHNLQKTGQRYPLHIGVTEAGMGVQGRIGSALGIMPLLLEGIGDTIRVSLTEAPKKEIHFAHQLMASVSGKLATHCSTSFNNRTLQIDCDLDDHDSFIAALAYEWTRFPDQAAVKQLRIRALNPANRDLGEEVANSIMQEAGMRNTGTRFVSCPACARTTSDMESLCRTFVRELGHYPGVSIAIMGCMVNGPGEMACADYGVIASQEGKMNLFEGEQCVAQHITARETIEYIQNRLRQGAHDKLE